MVNNTHFPPAPRSKGRQSGPQSACRPHPRRKVDSPDLENFTFEVGRTNPKGVLRSTLFTGLSDENEEVGVPGELHKFTRELAFLTHLYPRIDGLRQTDITVMVDTSVTHIMEQARDHTNQPEPRQGRAAPTGDPIAKRNAEKNGKY